MAAYSGLINNHVIADSEFTINPPVRSGIYDLAASPRPNANLIGLDSIQQTDAQPRDSKAAIRAHDFGDIIWGKIYISPSVIDVGFIVSETTHQILIWNAYEDLVNEITDINASNPDGTDLPYPPFPKSLPPMGSYQHTLTVKKDGPPVQQTVYTYDVTTGILTLTITGKRVVMFVWDHNWAAGGLSMSLALKTALNKNRRHKEQRRPLSSKVLRGVSVALMEAGVSGQKLINTLEYGHDKIFGVPIYTEVMTPITSLTGNSAFTVSESLTDFYHVQSLLKYVLIADWAAGVFGLYEVTLRVGSVFNLAATITETFSISTTKIYPTFLGMINEFKVNSVTNNAVRADVDFGEVILG